MGENERQQRTGIQAKAQAMERVVKGEAVAKMTWFPSLAQLTTEDLCPVQAIQVAVGAMGILRGLAFDGRLQL